MSVEGGPLDPGPVTRLEKLWPAPWRAPSRAALASLSRTVKTCPKSKVATVNTRNSGSITASSTIWLPVPERRLDCDPCLVVSRRISLLLLCHLHVALERKRRHTHPRSQLGLYIQRIGIADGNTALRRYAAARIVEQHIAADRDLCRGINAAGIAAAAARGHCGRQSTDALR